MSLRKRARLHINTQISILFKIKYSHHQFTFCTKVVKVATYNKYLDFCCFFLQCYSKSVYFLYIYQNVAYQQRLLTRNLSLNKERTCQQTYVPIEHIYSTLSLQKEGKRGTNTTTKRTKKREYLVRPTINNKDI